MKFLHRPRDPNLWYWVWMRNIYHISRHCEQYCQEEETLPLQHWVFKPNTNTKLLTPFYRIALTSLPKMSLRSWMRIQPNLQPGTSQRLANPPQDRMGTLVLRVARGSYLPSENTWGKEELLNVLDIEPSIPLLRQRGTEKRIIRPLPTLRHDWIPHGSGKLIQRQFGVWSGLKET